MGAARKGLEAGSSGAGPSLNNTYWLATVRPDGRPHVMPLFGVYLDGAMYFCSNPTRRKARNLAENPHCVITAATGDLDVVVEGDAVKVIDEAKLAHVAQAFVDKYGWPVTVGGRAFDAPYGAPDRGPAAVRGLRGHRGDGVRPRHRRAVRFGPLGLPGPLPRIFGRRRCQVLLT